MSIVKMPTAEQVGDVMVGGIARIPLFGRIVVGFWDWFYRQDRESQRLVVVVLALINWAVWTLAAVP